MLLDVIKAGWYTWRVWRVCTCGLNKSVHEYMKGISNVMLHLITRSGHVNI